MSEGVINYLKDNPIQLIILIVIALLAIACVIALCVIGAKNRKRQDGKGKQKSGKKPKKTKQTDEMLQKALTAINAKVAEFNEKSAEKKSQEKPAPYPMIDGLEEHYLPPKPSIPIRTAPNSAATPTAKAAPSKAPVPTIAKSPTAKTGKTVPIPLRPRVKPTPQPTETTEPTEPTQKPEPIQETDPIAASEQAVVPTEAVATDPNTESVAMPAPVQETESVPSPEFVDEIENTEVDTELMKNSESKTPLAAKSALLAMQKMMATDPGLAQTKPAAKSESKAAKPAAKAESKATKPVAKPAAKAEPKTAKATESKPAAKQPEAKKAAATKTAETPTVKKPTVATVKTTTTATFKSLKSSNVKKKKPKSARYTGKWVICRLLLIDNDDEQLEERYFFELRASNGEPLLTSEEYLTYEGAEKGIQTHKENILSDNFRIVPRGNEYVFKLLTAKNTLLCTGTPYKSIERCESAIASAKRFAVTAIVQEEPEDVSVKLPDDDDFDTTEIDEAYIKGRWIIMTGGNERIGTVYYFELQDGAGKKLLVSEEYATYEGAVNAVATYQTNIAKGNFRISVTKRGDYMFKLLGGNNQLLCLGEHFSSRKRCEWAIEVVRAFSRNSAVYKYGELSE